MPRLGHVNDAAVWRQSYAVRLCQRQVWTWIVDEFLYRGAVSFGVVQAAQIREPSNSTGDVGEVKASMCVEHDVVGRDEWPSISLRVELGDLPVGGHSLNTCRSRRERGASQI